MNRGGEKIQKILLMGKSGAGKTSMRSVIFANYLARDTQRITFTVEINDSKVKFLGNLVLNLWDCGGQDLFMEQYFQSQRDHIFKNVEVLIYVFDVMSRDHAGDLKYYKLCLKSLEEYSKGAKIFCLIHKMDLIAEAMRDQAFEARKREIFDNSGDFKVECFKTSVWDETLYKAWSQIVHFLIPNVHVLQQNLRELCVACSADEIVLFERSTFLVISHADIKGHEDIHRFEKISNIIKEFKLSCIKTNFQFQSMVVKNSKFSAVVEEFTKGTSIMVIYSDPDVEQETVILNIKATKEYFEKIVNNTLN